MQRLAILVFVAGPLFGQSGPYLGPSILSRGGSGTGDRAGSPAGFQFYAGAYGTYDTGLVPPSVDSSGKIINPSGLYGIGADLGAYGRRSFRRTTIGLDYTGNFRHYTSNSYYDGSDHVLGLHITNQTTRRLQLNTRINAGTLSQYYLSGPATANLLSSPGYGIFDNRAYYLETTAGFRYQKSSRLSFSGYGTGFFVRRQSKALVGLNGYSAQGEMDYRLNRTRTILGTYSFTHYDYPRGFGESDLHTYMLGIQQALGRRWEFGVSAGASRISTIGLEQVSTDPVTAALFGTLVTTQAFSRVITVGAGRAVLSGKFKQSRVELSYNQLPSAGNGVYLTSKSSNVEGNYSYVGIRRASLSLRGTYNRMSSIGQQSIGVYNYTSGGGGISYKLLGSLETSLQFDARNVQIDQTNGFARLSYVIRIGIQWHPGELPISFW